MQPEGVKSFAELESCIRECKLAKTCPSRQVRQFYFENESTARQHPAVFVCHSPATRTGAEDGVVRRTCWRTTAEDFHFNDMRRGIGLEGAYITNCVKCGSTVSNEPAAEEQRQCSRFLQKEIELVRPRVIVCVGLRAQSILQAIVHTDIPVLTVPHYSWRRRPNYDPERERQAYQAVQAFLEGTYRPRAPVLSVPASRTPAPEHSSSPSNALTPSRSAGLTRMTKEHYRDLRIRELGDAYRAANTAPNEWNMCIALECGEPSISVKNTSGGVCLKMFLQCQYTERQIVDELNRLFPGQSNSGRPRRMYCIFSGGKCRNVTEHRTGGVMGLKWDRYRFFDENGAWRNREP